MRVYAVGLKGWVELRKAAKPPQTRVTAAVKEIIEKRCKWFTEPDAEGHFYRNVEVPVKKRIRGIHTSGGKFLTSMKCRKFSDVTRIHILPGGVWEVPSELLPKLLGPSKRPRKEG